jgi:hypothetical protein
VNQQSIDPIAHGVANRGPTYGALSRYNNGNDHLSTIGGVPAGYRAEHVFGMLARSATPGTQPLVACRTGEDTFTSLSDTCEDRTMVGRLGWIYSAPPQGRPSAPVYRCKIKDPGPRFGEHFDSGSEACENQTTEGRLGYVVAQAQITRYNKGGELRTAIAAVAAGSQPQETLGALPQVQMPGTVPLYACELNGEGFTSKAEDCEGQTKLSRLGWIYTSPPQEQPSAMLYRCKRGTEHFDSLDPDCGDGETEGSLGYVVAEKALNRTVRGSDHRTGTGVFPAGYRHEGTWGYLSGTNEPGTRPLYSCQVGSDAFSSVAANCEGQQKLQLLGYLWDQPPPGVPSVRLYRCTVTETHEHFDAIGEGCEDQHQEGALGYVKAVP